MNESDQLQQYPASPPPAPPAPPLSLSYALPGAIHPYVSPRARANWTVGLLAVWVVLTTISLVSSVWQLQLLNRMEAEEEVTQEEISANDLRESAIGLAQLPLYFATVVVYLMWLFRVRKNLEPLGAHGAQYAPGWSIGAWFVPILNLFRPYQIVQEICKGSGPRQNASSGDMGWQFEPNSSAVGWWWFAWIVSLILNRISTRLSMRADEVDELIGATQVNIAAAAGSIVAALLCIAVVRLITARQEQTVAVPVASSAAAPYVPPV